MQIHSFCGGSCSTNGYVIELPTKNLLAIDAPEGFLEWILRKFPGKSVSHLLLTHQHFDHVEDAAIIQKKFATQIIAAQEFSSKLTLEDYARSFGMPISIEPYMVNTCISNNSANLGGLDWEIRPVPGHAPDHIIFRLPSQHIIFGGDTLMQNSIGRTDFPKGSYENLIAGIHQHILNLPNEYTIYPGHGNPTTNYREARQNPFLN